MGSAFRRLSPGVSTHEFVFAPHGDLRNPAVVEEILKTARPDCVIHCAAKVGGVKKNRDCPEEMFFDNVVMTANLIHAAARTGVKRFVAFGSNCMYGEVPELLPTNIHTGEPYVNNRAYGFAKRMVEVHLVAARAQYGMKTTYVVPVSMYGPEDNFSLEDAHVIPSLIHKCFLARDEFRVWGDGSAVREVVFSEDVARVVLQLLDSDRDRVVVGSGQFVSVKEMAETIARQMDFRGRIVWETDKPGGQKTRPPAQALNFAYTPFEEGVRLTCQWFREAYPQVRK
jgi:GDP-L-fucose synthase